MSGQWNYFHLSKYFIFVLFILLVGCGKRSGSGCSIPPSYSGDPLKPCEEECNKKCDTEECRENCYEQCFKELKQEEENTCRLLRKEHEERREREGWP
ncbi:MAG: hypothetical protein OXM55_05160 [Bdellovibrionales bacterium]|nr:hypothetical protein [Bdellovibrionales bacterium]